MNIENLKCFILVADNLSFARAAEALYISQPAVTKQISALEHELETRLFIRSPRHVELTAAGMAFYKDAKDIVEKAQMAVSRIKNQNIGQDSLRIGLSNPAALFYLAPLLKLFHENYPDINPVILTPGYKIALNLFLERKLDILFFYKENMTSKANIRFLELETDTLSCLLPSGHPLACKKSLLAEDLTDYTVIACNPLNAPLSMASFQQQFLQMHPAGKISYCDNIEIAHCMVSAQMGISILPSVLTLKSPEFSSVPIENSPALSFGAFYHKCNSNMALNHFLNLIKSKSAESDFPNKPETGRI